MIDFADLEAKGLTVVYVETRSPDVPPEGEGWEYWGLRHDPNGTVAVWRKTVPLSAVAPV